MGLGRVVEAETSRTVREATVAYEHGDAAKARRTGIWQRFSGTCMAILLRFPPFRCVIEAVGG